MKLATWNVNSLRVRLEHVLDWLANHQPDCLVLQETKTTDPDFPVDALQQAGYQVAYTGQKTYNGVAILSKHPLTNIVMDLPDVSDPSQRRFIAANIGSLHIVNVYVPNGASLDSPKFPYKLDWLDKLAHYLKQQTTQHQHVIVMGDFNIAPHDTDVANPEHWHDCILVSEPERTAFQTLLATGFVDILAQQNNAQGNFSWWDYRAGAFHKNLGMRIDHILTTPALADTVKQCDVDKAPRKLKRPSDHAPVWADFMITPT